MEWDIEIIHHTWLEMKKKRKIVAQETEKQLIKIMDIASILLTHDGTEKGNLLNIHPWERNSGTNKLRKWIEILIGLAT